MRIVNSTASADVSRRNVWRSVRKYKPFGGSTGTGVVAVGKKYDGSS